MVLAPEPEATVLLIPSPNDVISDTKAPVLPAPDESVSAVVDSGSPDGGYVRVAETFIVEDGTDVEDVDIEPESPMVGVGVAPVSCVNEPGVDRRFALRSPSITSISSPVVVAERMEVSPDSGWKDAVLLEIFEPPEISPACDVESPVSGTTVELLRIMLLVTPD